MRIGLKVFPDSVDNDYREVFDYFEVYVPPGMDTSLFEGRRTPLAVHAAHALHGFDMADPALHDVNVAIVETAIAAADAVKAPWIAIHPGLDHGPGSVREMMRFLEEHHDPRFALENCPVIDRTDRDKRYLCSLPAEMAEVTRSLDIGIVLDFAHAICTANILGQDHRSVIERFMRLGPQTYHLSGVDADATHDMHLHLSEADNDYAFLKDLPADASVTLETGANHGLERYLDDLAVLRAVRGD